jgi:hypothetical protein
VEGGAEQAQRRDGEEVECRHPSFCTFVEDKDEATVRVDGENRRCTVMAESPCAVSCPLATGVSH